MRPLNMSGHFLLAPIPECSSDYLLPKDIKLAVLGAGRVGKSGECGGDLCSDNWRSYRERELEGWGPDKSGRLGAKRVSLQSCPLYARLHLPGAYFKTFAGVDA